MSKETQNFVPKEVKTTAEKVTRLPKKVILFLGEKSIFVTAPVTAAAVVTGSIAIGTGALLLGADVIGSHWAGKKRKEIK